MTILFSGGGTLGSVTPLLAIAEVLRRTYPDVRLVWVGTIDGPERALVKEYGISFVAFPSGKLRRYASFQNITDLFQIARAFFRAIGFLRREHVDVCISVGGFVSVPIHWAAFLLGRKTWIHQQDVVPGLSNKLMARAATIITTALEKSTQFFPKQKTIWIGNPVRMEIFQGSSQEARRLFSLSNAEKPVVFITGGGTGAERINQIVIESLDKLEGSCEVLHLIGRDRTQQVAEQVAVFHPFYHPFPFFTTEMSHAYAVADLVVSRGGFGTITEIAALQKAAIFIPKNGHQEENIEYLVEQGAAHSLHEETTDGNSFAKAVKEMLHEPGERQAMGEKLGAILPVAKESRILEIFNTYLT